MGRTLHFDIVNRKELSEKDEDVMNEVSEKYNSGNFANVWTCENFYLDPTGVYPNWSYSNGQDGFKNSWDYLNELEKELVLGGLTMRNARRFLMKIGVARTWNANNPSVFGKNGSFVDFGLERI